MKWSLDREAELQRRIEQLEERATNAERDLEQFLYAISHDLRGPLRAIMSSSMILIEDYNDRLDAEGKSELQRQSRNAKRLSDIIEQILKVSRLGRQTMTPAELDLSAAASEAASSAGVDAIVQPGMSAVADADLAKKLFGALIDNSVKFARKDSPVHIEIGQKDGAYFVRDDGIGFPPEKAEEIFKPFDRLHPETEYPGWGMGLTMVRLIAQRHGGRAWAEGRPGEGATIWFTLPANGAHV
ncbi:sensor histidine kinase [Fimbriimonas ginsengisoli]|uniref:histidine kinase n=1 Tax=Fimbriimonas ginsengisoli Gsoil 348 TaxID=661478 RepID=A0A068NLT4_FIMGI|nr:ATP-binding protein [Fimbriimonas ginsengisoli]AIE84508.1 sensory transduction histidine kinase [Fimbriimonas ginsengisoli Gsoil 348]